MKTVKIKVELSLQDYNTVLDLFNDEKIKLLMRTIESLNKNDSEVSWYKDRINYIEELKKKIIDSSSITED